MTIHIGFVLGISILALFLAVFNFVNSLRIESFEFKLFKAEQVIKDLTEKVKSFENKLQSFEDDGR